LAGFEECVPLAGVTFVSVEGLEPSTNGLKGRTPCHASSNQEPSRITPVHWTIGEKSLLEYFIKGLSTRKQPMDLLHNNSAKASDWVYFTP
jgi:hypothetical protein